MLQAGIIRDTQRILSEENGNGVHYLQIVCIWQRGADALKQDYTMLVNSLPKGDNLEVMVVSKEELMKRFKVQEQAVETTYQINALCKNISQLAKDRHVLMYVDECWITVPKKYSAHLTHVGSSSFLY